MMFLSLRAFERKSRDITFYKDTTDYHAIKLPYRCWQPLFIDK